jgi:hypothetical protein
MVSMPCEAMYATVPNRGGATSAASSAACASDGVGSPACPPGDREHLGGVVQRQLVDVVDRPDARRLAVAERDDQQRREPADVGLLVAVGGGERGHQRDHVAEPLEALDRVAAEPALEARRPC